MSSKASHIKYSKCTTENSMKLKKKTSPIKKTHPKQSEYDAGTLDYTKFFELDSSIKHFKS
ncbi:hypothetical protein A3Q56_08484, partial [Intoshia linei]